MIGTSPYIRKEVGDTGAVTHAEARVVILLGSLGFSAKNVTGLVGVTPAVVGRPSASMVLPF
jgi:hypothetical protein